MDSMLEEAQKLYEVGDKQAAARILAALVKKEPDNANAWFGLGLCLDSEDKKKYCFQRTLSLNPEHKKAQRALAELSGEKPCPYCAELLKKEAVICGYCGMSLIEPVYTEQSTNILPLQTSSQEGFELRHLTMLIGLAGIVTTFLPWVVKTQGWWVIEVISGITTLPGIVLFLASGAIAITALTKKSQPGALSAPQAANVALIFLFVAGLSWLYLYGTYYEPCFADLSFYNYGDRSSCRDLQAGIGYFLMLLCMLTAAITGKLKNPKD